MRMTEGTYRYILGRIEHRIRRAKTKFRPVNSADLRLTIFLRFIAYGESQAALTQHFRVGCSTIHYIIKSVSIAIVEELMKEYIKVNVKFEHRCRNRIYNI